jgi:hypothetical protein
MICFLCSRAPQSTSVASPRGAMRRTASDAGRAAANLLDASKLPASDGLIRTARKRGSARPPQQQQQQEVTKRTAQHALDALQPSVPPLGRRVRAKLSTQISTDDGLARCASSCAALRWLHAPYAAHDQFNPWCLCCPLPPLRCRWVNMCSANMASMYRRRGMLYRLARLTHLKHCRLDEHHPTHCSEHAHSSAGALTHGRTRKCTFMRTTGTMTRSGAAHCMTTWHCLSYCVWRALRCAAECTVQVGNGVDTHCIQVILVQQCCDHICSAIYRLKRGGRIPAPCWERKCCLQHQHMPNVCVALTLPALTLPLCPVCM